MWARVRLARTLVNALHTAAFAQAATALQRGSGQAWRSAGTVPHLQDHGRLQVRCGIVRTLPAGSTAVNLAPRTLAQRGAAGSRPGLQYTTSAMQAAPACSRHSPPTALLRKLVDVQRKQRALHFMPASAPVLAPISHPVVPHDQQQRARGVPVLALRDQLFDHLGRTAVDPRRPAQGRAAAECSLQCGPALHLQDSAALHWQCTCIHVGARLSAAETRPGAGRTRRGRERHAITACSMWTLSAERCQLWYGAQRCTPDTPT